MGQVLNSNCKVCHVDMLSLGSLCLSCNPAPLHVKVPDEPNDDQNVAANDDVGDVGAADLPLVLNLDRFNIAIVVQVDLVLLSKLRRSREPLLVDARSRNFGNKVDFEPLVAEFSVVAVR